MKTVVFLFNVNC